MGGHNPITGTFAECIIMWKPLILDVSSPFVRLRNQITRLGFCCRVKDETKEMKFRSAKARKGFRKRMESASVSRSLLLSLEIVGGGQREENIFNAVQLRIGSQPPGTERMIMAVKRFVGEMQMIYFSFLHYQQT